MATRPDITGATTCATVIPFPLSQIMRFRVELAKCHSSRMVDRWLARLQRDTSLSQEDYATLAARGLDHGKALRLAGGC